MTVDDVFGKDDTAGVAATGRPIQVAGRSVVKMRKILVWGDKSFLNVLTGRCVLVMAATTSSYREAFL
jgi:hypothetical protein